MQHSKFLNHCFQRLSMFTTWSKSASRLNLGTHAFRLARVFDTVLLNKELNLNFETQWIMLGVMLVTLTIKACHGHICILQVYLLFLMGVWVIEAAARLVVVKKLLKIVDDRWQAWWGFGRISLVWLVRIDCGRMCLLGSFGAWMVSFLLPNVLP